MLQALEGLVFAVRVSVLRAICAQPLEECAIRDKLSTVCDTAAPYMCLYQQVERDAYRPEAYSA